MADTERSIKGEKFAVVDEADNVMYNVYGLQSLHTGDNPRKHRAIHVLIETFGGGFVLQKKAVGTENEGKWSSAVSGHVRFGETYRQAAIRETHEELGLEIDRKDLHHISKIHPCKETGSEFVSVYTYLMDPNSELIKPDANEVEIVIIRPLKEVAEDIERNKDIYSEAFILAMDVFLTLYKKEGAIHQNASK